MISLVDPDGRLGGPRDLVPGRSKAAVAPIARYAMPHVLTRAV